MLKEIHEQSAAPQATLADRLCSDWLVELPELDLTGVERVIIIACGTDYLRTMSSDNEKTLVMLFKATHGHLRRLVRKYFGLELLEDPRAAGWPSAS
jgi:hypothetical protein